MSRLVNNNFNRDTKLDPSSLNSKFQDVSTAVNSQVDDNNIRDSAIDIPQFNIGATNGKQGIQLSANGIATNEFSGATVSNASIATPVQLGSNWTAFGGQLVEGDTIRVYWHSEFSKDLDNTATPTEIAYLLNRFFATYLEWNFNSAGFTPVPGQTRFDRGTPTAPLARKGTEVENTKATCLIPFARIINDGTTAANVAPTNPAPIVNDAAIITSDIVDYYANSKHMASGCWVHTVTGAEAGSATIQFRLMATGPITPYYENAAGNESNWLVGDVNGAIGFVAPTITFDDTNMVFMVMRSK